MKRSRRFWRVMMVMSGLGFIVVTLLFFLPTPSVSGDVIYVTTWDRGETSTSDAGGWQVMTDLGYVVQVDAGYLVSYSTTLNECPHSHTLWERLLELLMPAVVYAGHGSEFDPAMVAQPIVEDLIVLEDAEWGRVTVNEPTYCEGHFLISNTNTESEFSLYIEGTYQRHGIDNAVPFTIESKLAWGTIGDLIASGENVHAQIGNDPVTIQIVRQLDSMFDGIDFVEADFDLVGRDVLRNLADNTTFVVIGKTHAA